MAMNTSFWEMHYPRVDHVSAFEPWWPNGQCPGVPKCRGLWVRGPDSHHKWPAAPLCLPLCCLKGLWFPWLGFCARGRFPQLLLRTVPVCSLLHGCFCPMMSSRPWFKWFLFYNWWSRNVFEVVSHYFPRNCGIRCLSCTQRLYLENSDKPPTHTQTRKDCMWWHWSPMDWLSKKSQGSPRIEKERRGVGARGPLVPPRFYASVLPLNIVPWIWCSSCLLAEPLQTGI